MWPQRDLVVLTNTLVVDPGFNQIISEDAAACEVLVVDLQRVQHLGQRAWRALHLALELGLQLVEVFVDRLGRLALVYKPRETGHQAGGDPEARVGRRVRRT